MTLTSNELRWYHNEQERINRKPLGAIELEFIYSVVKSYQVHNDRPAFLISVTMFKDKKGNNVVNNRDVIFSADTDEIRDKWIIAIEYLKTKAIYDAYAAKNRNVGFNALGSANDMPQNHDNDRFNKQSLLVDFGFALKQKTTYSRMNRTNSLPTSMNTSGSSFHQRRATNALTGTMPGQRRASLVRRESRIVQLSREKRSSSEDGDGPRLSYMRR